MDEPDKVGEALAAMFRRAEPRWTACDGCGGQTSGRTCFDCQRKRDRRADAKGKTDATIPELFAWARLGAPELLERVSGNRRLLAQAEAALGATRVLLLGRSGAGKTSLAVAMLRAWSDLNGEPGAFALATDLASARKRDNRFGQEAAEVVTARGAKLLVIDDLGTELADPQGALTEVIFYRHAHCLPTWVTTWLGDEAIVARYGDGMARRLLQGARIIECARAE